MAVIGNRNRNISDTIFVGNLAFIINRTNFSQFHNITQLRSRILAQGEDSKLAALNACISLRRIGLGSHNDLTGASDDLFIVSLVNVAGQSGDEQSSQDGQDDQNDDQFDEGEALFVFQFFERLVFLQLFVFVPTLQDLIGISYRHFITQFVFCQAKTCCKNPFCVFLLFSSLEFIGNRALFMNFNERLRYLIDCEEIKLKDLAPKLCLSASTLSNYAQGIREPDYDTLRRIADYFGVSIDYLLGHETPAVDDERQLLTCYRSFTPSQKRFLLDQAALIKRYKIRLDD